MGTRTFVTPHEPAGAPSPLPGGGAPLPAAPYRNALPEFHQYVDSGCHVHPTCLSCPLPSCLFDAPRKPSQVRTGRRQRFIFYARAREIPWHVIAGYLHLSTRQVHRLAQAARRSTTLTLQAGFGSLDPLPSTIRRSRSLVT